MPAQIILNQPTKPPGGIGKGRRDLATGLVVTATNNTVEGSYLWTLTDAPIRSALVRGTTGTSAAFTFTPDVKGTYVLTLQVNGSTLTADNEQTFGAVVSFGAKTLGWRYLGAGEQDQADNINYPGLGFPGNTNTRGWATERDIELEQTETATYDVLNAATVSPGLGLDSLTRINPATGRLDPSLIPAATGTSGPIDYVGALNEEESVLNVERITGGFKLAGADIQVGRALIFACIASYAPVAVSGQIYLRLYDMGGLTDGPAAGILRSQIAVPYNTLGTKYFSQTLTATSTPGINADEVYDVPRKYEVRLLLSSSNVGDTAQIVWGGVRAD